MGGHNDPSGWGAMMGLLGFAIEKQQGAKPWLFLFNSLTFPDKVHTFPQFRATPSDKAPLQKFRWADYAVNPGVTIHYRVHLAYGSPDAPQLGESLEVTVTSDDGQPANQWVIFNRAVAASQAFSQKLYEAAARDANAAGTSASGQSGNGSVDDDEIVDAEIVDEDGEQK